MGVGVFVFYQFVQPPLLYNPAHEAAVVAERGATYDALEESYASAFTLREEAALAVADAGTEPSAEAAMQTYLAREADVEAIRGQALALAEDVTGLVLFLASDHSSCITATNFNVDGGVTQNPY